MILQGDRKQHSSPQRGSVFHLLQDFGGVPVVRLTHIWRQTDRNYKKAVAAIAKGDIVGGHDVLAKLGWIKQMPGENRHGELVEDYVNAIHEKKKSGKPMDALVVAPTHREIAEITAGIRRRLQAEGLVQGEEHRFAQLTPLHWTDAEKGDRDRYAGTEIIQFHYKAGTFKAGDRVEAAGLLPQLSKLNPEHFSVYRPGEITLAAGDKIRITSNGRDRSGEHRLNNGSAYRVQQFTPEGDIVLSNGWVLGRDYAHLSHGYCITSNASQSITDDQVLISMGRDSQAAMNAAQFYVSASRGRSRCTIYSDLSPDELREAIQAPTRVSQPAN